MAKTQQKQSNAPAHRIRSGALSVSIWEHAGDNGSFYTADAQRAYTRDDGKTWEYSNSFAKDEIPTVALLLQSAWAWINRKQEEGKAAK